MTTTTTSAASAPAAVAESPSIDESPPSSVEEEVDFGHLVGTLKLYQFSGRQFHEKCLQANSQEEDSTGLRIHAGAHVAIRFLLRFPSFMRGRKVVELGCGTGVLGLVATRGGNLTKQLVLTDGSPLSVDLAEVNRKKFQSHFASEVVGEKCGDDFGDVTSTDLEASQNRRVSCHELLWGDKQCALALLEQVRVAHFDVVIGCELMYYRTSAADLVTSILHLVHPDTGLFISAHIFRRRGQDQEFIDALHEAGWEVLRVPFRCFCEKEELASNPSWYNAPCLIAGPRRITAALLTKFGQTARTGQDNASEAKESAENDMTALNYAEEHAERISGGGEQEKLDLLQEGALHGLTCRVFSRVDDDDDDDDDDDEGALNVNAEKDVGDITRSGLSFPSCSHLFD